MTAEDKHKFTVITNSELETVKEIESTQRENAEYHSNPMYQKLLEFRALQEKQKKRFSVEDLFKLC